MHFDLAIVGYGPVGAAAANIFAAKGFNIIVIEPKKEIWDIPRAVHFDGQVQRIFQSMGIFDQIEKIIDPIMGINFINRSGKNLLSVGFEDHPKLNGYFEGVMFNQPKFEEILRTNALKYNNIQFELGSYVSSLEALDDINNFEVINNSTNEKSNFSSTYLIGSDGADSFVRKSLGIKMHDYNCDQDWVVVDYLVDDRYEILDKSRYQICDYKRPTTLLPITDNHVRWEFKINPDDDVDKLESEENIRKFMSPHMWRINPDIDVNSGKLIRSSKYTFHGLLVDQFRVKNSFLIGDAAHQTPPFLGQGLCQGIKDAHNLCWKLVGVRDGNFNKKILDSFNDERKEVNDFMIRTAIKQGDVIGSQDRLKAFFRDMFFMFAKKFPKALSALKFQYSWKFHQGIMDNDLYPNEINGVIIPQPDIDIRLDGKQFDQFIGESFALIIFNEKQSLIKDLSAIEAIKFYKNNIYVLGENHPFMSDGKLASWASLNNVSAVIIRPDKHVYGCCDSEDMLQKVENLTKKLHNDLKI